MPATEAEDTRRPQPTEDGRKRIDGAYGDYDPKLRVEVGVRRHSDPFTSLFPTAPGGASVLAGSENGFTSNATLTQLFQEARRILHILVRCQHVLKRAEFAAVIIVIDLHAAEIDELGA